MKAKGGRRQLKNNFVFKIRSFNWSESFKSVAQGVLEIFVEVSLGEGRGGTMPPPPSQVGIKNIDTMQKSMQTVSLLVLARKLGCFQKHPSSLDVSMETKGGRRRLKNNFLFSILKRSLGDKKSIRYRKRQSLKLPFIISFECFRVLLNGKVPDK